MNHPRILLSRLRIVGDVDSLTPLCVLEEILDSHRIGFKRGIIHPEHRRSLINHIQKIPVTKLGSHLSSTDLKTLVTYINVDRKCKWTPKTLFEAYKFLNQFSGEYTEKDILNLVPEKIVAGAQNPDQIHNLNACVLYKICKAKHIMTYPNTTLSSMGLAVKLLKGGSDMIYSVLSNFMIRSDPEDIINAFVTGQLPEDRISQSLEEVSYESLNTYISESPYLATSNPPTKLGERIIPITKSEAVGLGAMMYQIDFSISHCPISEFRKYTASPARYIPIDETLREMMIINPGLIDLRLTFNPIFPREYYNQEALLEMAIYEGCDPQETTSMNCYEMLQMSYLLENFYEGLYPEIENSETPIAYDEVNELDPGLIICYGVRRETLVAFNIEELVEHFCLVKTFAHPINVHSTLPPNAIAKLKMIAQDAERHTEQAVLMKGRLLRAIEEVEFLSNEANAQAREFFEYYSQAAETIQEEIKATVNGLLYTAMFMRGWPGGDHPFPIREAPVHDQIRVDIDVSNSIAEFEKKCRDMGDVGHMILHLPLMKYQGEFNLIGSEDNGYNIQDRLNIVKSGESTGNMQSCIRLTSNILAATAYRYLVLLSVPAPFPIEELRHIS